jgi:hypothetical protein
MEKKSETLGGRAKSLKSGLKKSPKKSPKSGLKKSPKAREWSAVVQGKPKLTCRRPLPTSDADFDYETVVFDHDPSKEQMLEALGFVRDYIRRQQLILVGGMAIDMALRSLNRDLRLYADNKLPDYDFYSPDFHGDAYRIGASLGETREGVSVINAFHASTMKVRLNFQEVADISYIPPDVYGRIPTLTHQGFRIVHPWFQMVDQHRALSFPFEKPPLETVLGRWKKDITRYDLLNENFPVKPDKIPADSHTFTVDLKKNPVCVAGETALLYWLQEGYKAGFKPSEAPPAWLSSPKWVVTNGTLKVTAGRLCLLTDHPDEALESIRGQFGKAKATRYNAVLDKVLPRTEIGPAVLLNNRGNLITASPIAEGLHVANLQPVMCWLLTMGVMYKSPGYLGLYRLAQDLLFWACGKYDGPPSTVSQFLPVTTVFGSSNTYDAYDVSKGKIDARFERKTPAQDTPRNAYPTPKKKINPDYHDFNPASSPLYQFDGAPVGPDA